MTEVPGRRASDRVLQTVMERQEAMISLLEASVIDRQKVEEFDLFRSEYIEKSIELGDPHNWIKTVGQPTAKDFNRLKTVAMTLGVLLTGLYGLVKLFAHDVWNSIGKS